MDRIESAREYFLKGHSCAQAVFAAYREELNLTESEALALASMLGGGIACTRETCGAVSAALLVLGAREKLIAPEEKKEAYRVGQEFLKEFGTKFQSTNCKKLLELADAKFYDTPMERNAEYYAARPCLRFVEGAVELLEQRK